MKEIFIAILFAGIIKGMDRLGISFFQPRSRKIIYLNEYRRRRACPS